MRICFVGPSNSAHIIKWCDWFSRRGHEVHVISFTDDKIASAEVHPIDIGVDPRGGELAKMKYMLTGKKIKKLIDEISPDIVNAHYATSYGVAMALSGVKNYILSVWGSDIYDFPKKSPVHKALLKFSLNSARYLFSTSQAMADEAGKYVNRKFYITPFGVDMKLFNPDKRTRTSSEPFTIGTVKSMIDLYGINYIIEAVSVMTKEFPDVDIRVRLAGDGEQLEEYKALAEKLGAADKITFLGRITQDQAAAEWADMDAAVIPSVSYESFGVAAVEAQACGTPVIVSEVGGLMEATSPGNSSLVVPTKNVSALADAILTLYGDRELCRNMGRAGIAYVKEKYELNRCFRKIEHYYDQIKEKIK